MLGQLECQTLNSPQRMQSAQNVQDWFKTFVGTVDSRSKRRNYDTINVSLRQLLDNVLASVPGLL